MNEDVNGNRKFFWKELSNVKGRKVESCSRIKNGNGRLAQGEYEGFGKSFLKSFLYNIDTQEEVALMGIREVTTSEESQLEELRLR